MHRFFGFKKLGPYPWRCSGFDKRSVRVAVSATHLQHDGEDLAKKADGMSSYGINHDPRNAAAQWALIAQNCDPHTASVSSSSLDITRSD
jgi:hypothetical protein